MSEPLLIFLSYDKTSRPEVARLKKELERFAARRAGRGKFHIFLDEDDIKPGDPFEETLMAALNRAVIGLVFVTDSIIRRKWCVREILHLAERRKNGDPVRIVPVTFQDDSDIFPDSNRSIEELQTREERYQSGLSPDQKKAVETLRALHLYPGLVFVEKNPDDGAYTQAADDLAEQFVHALRDPAVIDWMEKLEKGAQKTDEPETPTPKKKTGLVLSVVAALVVIAAALDIFLGGDKPVGPSDNAGVVIPGEINGPVDREPLSPVDPIIEWIRAGSQLINESGENLRGLRLADVDAPLLEEIGRSEIRPDPDAVPDIERATIDDVVWFRYQTADGDWVYVAEADGIRVDGVE